MGSFLLSFGFFNYLHHINKKIWGTDSMSNNFTAMTHASFSVIALWHYLLVLYYSDLLLAGYIFNVVRIVSTGYFMYDSFNIILRGKRSALNMLYLYHHFATAYMINHDHLVYNSGSMLFLGEFSNLPMYLVYYYLKTNNQVCLFYWKRIQLFLYSIIRCPMLTYLLYITIRDTENLTPVYVILPVYFMGIYWTTTLYKKL